ncbi:hypothetical protein PHMEG_00018615 [Phytophthora megakarya]|uniref:Jacalin-type lectin domain-containing protein n=1 Tax=Phytophthora megakarya TaxID=4795 RepID=A0A225VW71_9STRA|nr:hypothetical protein PHMEG_00018615 [Phytophthora megakarya]
MVALVSINSRITIAKPALRLASFYDMTFSEQTESDEAEYEERAVAARGGGGGGRGGGGARGTVGGRGGGGTGTSSSRRYYYPVAGGYGAAWGDQQSELPPGAYFGQNFGGPHGDGFSDETLMKSAQKVVSISLRAGERVDSIILTIVNPTGQEVTLFHGGNGGNLIAPLKLADGEYITFMEAHSGKHNDHTRIKYIKFSTNKGNSIEGGIKTDTTKTDTAKEGYQLSGFVGRCGNELDMVGAIWTSIQPVT